MGARRRYQQNCVLPEEYGELFPARDHLQPEHRLMLAVLEDALVRFQKYWVTDNPHGKTLFEEVEGWFMAENDGSLYSLETICATLDIEPSCLRKRLLVWKAEASAAGRRRNGSCAVGRLLLYSRKKQAFRPA